MEEDDYIQPVEDAFVSIMQGGWDFYSVLFQDVTNVVFKKSDTDVGLITLGQAESIAPMFKTPGVSASVMTQNHYNYSSGYGDIWVNAQHNESVIYNVWKSGDVSPGTAAFKILLEEVSHVLGIDVIAGNFKVRNNDINSHKYTITSYAPHPELVYYDPMYYAG